MAAVSMWDQQVQERIEQARARLSAAEAALAANPDSWDLRKTVEYDRRLLTIWEERLRDGR